MSGQHINNPPKQITLVYQYVDGEHLFFADELPGLCVASSSLKDAYALASEGVADQIYMRWDKRVVCRPDLSIDELDAAVRELTVFGASPVVSRGRVRFDINGSVTETQKESAVP